MGSDSPSGCPAQAAAAETLEDALGPAKGRYFAAGYRRVVYDLKNVRPDRSVVGGLSAVGVVSYPSQWSVDESGRERTPHLSSVDAIVLPILTLEAGATPELLNELCDYRVGAIDLRSGSEPWLDLASVPVSQRSVAVSEQCRNIRAVVGNIRSNISLVRGTTATMESARLASGRSFTSVYGGLFKANAFHTHISGLELRSMTLRATHEFSSPHVDAELVGIGIESSYWPAPTVIDYLVTMGQLTQVLIYESEHASRGRIGNLWMRSMHIDVKQSSMAPATRVSSETRLLRNRLVVHSGRRIHDVLVESVASSGVHARAALAYTEGEL